MFLTNDANKSPLSSLFGDGLSMWNGIELQMRRFWFVVEFEETYGDGDDALAMIKTLLLSRPEHLVDLLKQGVVLLSVYLVIPLPSFENAGWDMARLKGIWEAAEPEEPRMKATIYVGADGHHFVESNVGTTVDQLKDWMLLLECPDVATKPPEPTTGRC